SVFSSDGGVTWTQIAGNEQTYNFEGECTGGGGGDCEPGIMELPFDASFNEFAGNMFDVTAIGGEDVEIEGFDVNIDPGTALISVYYREGSYVGFENSSAGWTLMGRETVTSAGENMPTYVDVGGLIIPDGDTYGIYVTVTDYPSTNMNYTNGNNSFSDTYLQVNTGIGKGNPDFTGATFLERSWNGTIHYCAGEGGGGEPGDCETGTFSSRAAFEAAFSGTLNLEDFAGGPGDLVGCDGPLNSGGNSCFPAGEILQGISITTSTPSEPDPTVFLPAGMFGNTIDMVGSNQFASYTIIEFPNNDVSAFGFDLIALLGGGNVKIRIFGTGGLIETLSVNASSQV